MNIRPKNSFFGDPVLFQMASSIHSVLVPQLAELGAYVMRDDVREKARLVNAWRPQFRSCYTEWNPTESMDIHPAYHSLLTHSRHAGIASSLFDSSGEEASVCYQARAARLFLLSGLESGHLEELCQTSAAFHILSSDPVLLKKWCSLLISPVHDPSSRPLSQKHSASIVLAVGEPSSSNAPLLGTVANVIGADSRLQREIYEISGYKTPVTNPLLDGFIVSAREDKKNSLFLVPRFLETGQVNGIFFSSVEASEAGMSVPSCHVRFEKSHGWVIGETGKGSNLLEYIRRDLVFDHAVMMAGAMRYVLYQAITCIRQYSDQINEISLVERVLADAALDCAAGSALVLRVARSLDLAEENMQEAMFATIMRPSLRYWLLRILGQIIDCATAAIESCGLFKGQKFISAKRLQGHDFYLDGNINILIPEVIEAIRKMPDLFRSVIAMIGSEIGSSGARTTQVLQVAADIAIRDQGAAFLLIEQLVYASASAILGKLDCDTAAAAYTESRLGGQWRSAYGTLSPRYNARFILEALYPSH